MTNYKSKNAKRVLVVDDSTVTRKVIAAILNADPDLQVIGEAADGLEGVRLAAELRPDVITMDLNMPNMNGDEATRRIMAAMPTPIVVVTSISREDQIHGGLDILLEGALEIVQKPGSLSEKAYKVISDELVSKVKAVAQVILR
ncbi:MAG: response regulator [Ardenticatenaceae bacterium]|nr:response regulator [Ardenticatenaceae bacterium]MCB9444365.1 response regulator [Ardenticatenaceae bacterium]